MLINSNIIWFKQNIPFIRDVERKSKFSFIIFSKAESGTNPKGFFEDLNPLSLIKNPHSGYARDSRIISLRYVTSGTRDFISGIFWGFFGWSLQLNRHFWSRLSLMVNQIPRDLYKKLRKSDCEVPSRLFTINIRNPWQYFRQSHSL